MVIIAPSWQSWFKKARDVQLEADLAVSGVFDAV